MHEADAFATARERMVAQQIAARGIVDRRVLAALAGVPRELFVGDAEQAFAYDDRPLPIAAGQTISQPYVVALTVEALRLRGDERVLEIGAGSGYSAAVLGRLAAHVHSIERVMELAEQARSNLRRAGVRNVQVHCADGTLGWPAGAPYQAIAVTAAGPAIPTALQRQLAPGGAIVMPVGDRHGLQVLQRWSLGSDGMERVEPLCDVRFVPLLGIHGFPG